MSRRAFDCITVIIGLLLSSSLALSAQSPAAAPADVGSIADIVRVSYEVFSGPAGAPRQWRRDSTLYMPGATFVSVDAPNGKVKVTIMTPDEYRRTNNAEFVKNGIFETEIGRRIERYSNVAEVRSVTVARTTPNGPVNGRWVNYFHLYWDGSRWWIASMVWDRERPGHLIPKEWVGHWEVVSR